MPPVSLLEHTLVTYLELKDLEENAAGDTEAQPVPDVLGRLHTGGVLSRTPGGTHGPDILALFILGHPAEQREVSSVS